MVPAEPGPVRVQRAPATRDQVDAYRFGVRRTEAALVRADPVPLHEQIRSQRRAVVAGALLGLLALGVAALLPGGATDWQQRALVRGERSGVLYAVAAGPPRLVPVADPVAGRLVLAALGRPDGAAVPVAVSDAVLATAPRTPPAAARGAVGVALDGAAVPPAWAVCDTAPAAGPWPGDVTVLAGSLGPGPEGAGPSLLLTAEGGATYLVHDGRRHRLDPSDRDALSGLGLLGAPVRRVAGGLLSAIPEGPALRVPAPRPDEVPGLGRAGDVVVTRPLGAPAAYHLVVDGGLAPVPVTLADAVLSRSGQGRPTTLPQGRVATAPVATVPGAGAWPAARLAGTGSAPVLCRTWRDGRGGVVAGERPPVAAGSVAVTPAGADGPGPALDGIVLPPSGPGPLRARSPGAAGDAGGTRWLLAASGAVFGVADDPTAAALGITVSGNAPADIVRLLPRGGVLDVAAARGAADVPG
ncbi:hypothetical protein AD006_09585 [Pseudonocardia sp. EC080610-09]|nr:hypothetical protein FRP1_01965 [Pseudonocardia sp. EC080625-04]ALL75501.1 hypothetical protein AD006_09585 [Pseudonocardia sp. EC080610-09]ALL82527.1 hypothetical protein AD017_17415 [Pseudonocardia sp. EC080619-01]